MYLAKTFFGYNLTSAMDYVIAYSVSLVVIIVCALILKALKKKDKPSSPEEIAEKCIECRKLLEQVISVSEKNKNLNNVFKKIVKLQLSLNSLVYSCTIIIDELRDITFEKVRNSFTNAINIIDDAKITSDREKFISALNSAVDELKTAETQLSTIDLRYKKIGR